MADYLDRVFLTARRFIDQPAHDDGQVMLDMMRWSRGENMEIINWPGMYPARERQYQFWTDVLYLSTGRLILTPEMCKREI